MNVAHNEIPYFGALVAVAISILITLFTDGIGKAILMAIIVIVLQQIDANIINPKIIGNSLKISQLLVLFIVLIANINVFLGYIYKAKLEGGILCIMY